MTKDSVSKNAICAFTEEGLREFNAWLDRAEKAEPRRLTAEPPPVALLFDERYAREVGFGNPCVRRRFDKKYDLGMAVCAAANAENMRQLLANPNAWAWLSLYFHESTMPLKKGLWFTGVRSRHVVDTIEGRTQDQSHRHLVKGAATNVFRFGSYAAVLMGSPSGMSKIEEQIMSRKVDPPLAHLPELVKTLYRLYWDVDADDVKPGASGEANGSIMHFQDIVDQFDLTFDISHLEAERLYALLPAAFDRFKERVSSAANRRRVRRSEGPSATAV